MYQGGETTDGRRIYVGNINYDYSENEIRNAFNDVRFTLLQICSTTLRAHTALRWRAYKALLSCCLGYPAKRIDQLSLYLLKQR